MTPPEPCLEHPCRAPIACNGWGYCRIRNWDSGISRLTGPSAAQQLERRAVAAERRTRAEAAVTTTGDRSEP